MVIGMGSRHRFSLLLAPKTVLKAQKTSEMTKENKKKRGFCFLQMTFL